MTPTLTRINTSTNATALRNIYISPIFFTLIYGLFSKYLLLSVEAGIVLSLILTQFKKPFTPPSLLYFFVYMWLQVFMIIVYADYKGENIEKFIDTHNSNFLLSVTFMHVAIMAIAATIFQKNIKGSHYKLLKGVAQINTKKVLLAYLISSLTFPFLLAFTRSMSSVNQLIESFTVLRKVFLVLLAFILFLKKDRLRGIIIFVFILEFLLGFVSYFSSFKEVVLYILLVFITVNPKIKLSTIISISPLITILVVALIYWSYIKPEYRDYLNGGTGQQVVGVSKSAALDYLWKGTKKFDKAAFDSGTETLIDRIQAMRYYLEVYDRVPSVIPYSNGENLASCLNFLLLPRFISANKGILDPSTKLSYYSGKRYMNAEEGTSIAMGYFCDFYVDYGVWGMIIPVALTGLLIGWAMNYIMGMQKLNSLFIYSLIIAIFLTMGTLENDIIFFWGYIRNFFVLFILGNWFIFPWINKFITKPN